MSSSKRRHERGATAMFNQVSVKISHSAACVCKFFPVPSTGYDDINAHCHRRRCRSISCAFFLLLLLPLFLTSCVLLRPMLYQQLVGWDGDASVSGPMQGDHDTEIEAWCAEYSDQTEDCPYQLRLLNRLNDQPAMYVQSISLANRNPQQQAETSSTVQ